MTHVSAALLSSPLPCSRNCRLTDCSIAAGHKINLPTLTYLAKLRTRYVHGCNTGEFSIESRNLMCAHNQNDLASAIILSVECHRIGRFKFGLVPVFAQLNCWQNILWSECGLSETEPVFLCGLSGIEPTYSFVDSQRPRLIIFVDSQGSNQNVLLWTLRETETEAVLLWTLRDRGGGLWHLDCDHQAHLLEVRESARAFRSRLNARSSISTMLAKIFTRDAQGHSLVQTTHFKQIFKAVQNPRGITWSNRAFLGSWSAEVGPIDRPSGV